MLGNLDEAKEILDIADQNPGLTSRPDFVSPSFDVYRFAKSPPTRFGEKYRDEIRNSQKIECFLNANVVDIRLDDDLKGVKAVRVQNYNGQKVDVSAKQFVLAFGGLETPRILLNANSQIPAGIGNHSDMVGRCFMESLQIVAGRFLVTDPSFWTEPETFITPKASLMKQYGVGTGILDFAPRITNLKVFQYSGRLGPIKNFLRDTGCYSPAITDMARRLITDFNCPSDGLITTLIEQEPNVNSRITLMNDVDAFGLRRMQMNWQLSERDFRSIRVLATEAAKEMARMNLARVQLAPAILEKGPIETSGHGHHQGTARMSADPRHGVVDGNCQVHGIRNLYVVGCSAFPKCGGRNPTMSAVLLALRLGNFLNIRA
jgi:choline dehydrogenase-like flavoprotein